MKFFPKQSKCPYCGTIYRYGDLRKLTYKKTDDCYHCKKKFKVSRKSLLIFAAEMLLIYIAANTFMILMIKSLTFILLFSVNLIITIAALLIMPMYFCLVKSEKSK